MSYRFHKILLHFPKVRSLERSRLFVTWENKFSQVCYSVLWVRLFVCLFVCSHDTGRISRPIDLKLSHNMTIRYRSKPIVFRQNHIQDGGRGGHFVSKNILKNSQKLHFSTGSAQNLNLHRQLPCLSTYEVS